MSQCWTDIKRDGGMEGWRKGKHSPALEELLFTFCWQVVVVVMMRTNQTHTETYGDMATQEETYALMMVKGPEVHHLLQQLQQTSTVTKEISIRH